jgi:uncharacterized protein YlxW (UPF0749 family)
VRRRWRLAVPLVLALAGALFATSAGASRGGELRGGARSDLPDLIRAEESRLDRATDRVEGLRADLAAATDAAAENDARIGEVTEKAADLAFAAGVGAVTGPGLSVTLADAPRTVDRLIPKGTSPDDLVVHQQDVQAVVNALWAGGAEALQIMDQRVISTSAVRCVGNTLILQGRVYSPPYVVKAIGDPDRLSRALDTSVNVGLYRFYAERYGLVYETATARKLRLPGFDGALDLLYAQVPV